MEIFDDLYVLTIPGFYWQAVYNGNSPRTRHTCEVIGNRQMVVVGGLSNRASWTDPDPFLQGLGIFDMTDMNWSPSYNANAAAYESSEAVKSWYDQG